jgi:hypothetical protein
MVFALDNADAAAEVVDTLAESLSLPETPMLLKVTYAHRCTRLYCGHTQRAFCTVDGQPCPARLVLRPVHALTRPDSAPALTLLTLLPVLQVARLFLVSDILHNATAPVRNASLYRTKLQAVLPDIFAGLADTYRCVGKQRLC